MFNRIPDTSLVSTWFRRLFKSSLSQVLYTKLFWKISQTSLKNANNLQHAASNFVKKMTQLNRQVTVQNTSGQLLLHFASNQKQKFFQNLQKFIKLF